jgi:hypothetical protein
MIVLRLDSEHRNVGDKAINASQIIVLRKVSDKHKTKLTLIVPGLHKPTIIAGLEALPDIVDVFHFLHGRKTFLTYASIDISEKLICLR